MVSDEVSQFLKEAAQLRDQQIQEDQRRSSQLEEEIMAARLERQARRAERARSISPQKSSPASTPPPPLHRLSPSVPFIPPLDGPTFSESLANTTIAIPADPDHEPDSLPDTSEMAAPHRPQLHYHHHTRSLSSSPTKDDSPLDHDEKRSSLMLPSSSRAMSWQRRPAQTTDNAPRSRPLSMVATENNAHARQRSKTGPSLPMTGSAGDFSREQISRAFASRHGDSTSRLTSRAKSRSGDYDDDGDDDHSHGDHSRDDDDDHVDKPSEPLHHGAMSPEPSKLNRRGSMPGTPRGLGLGSPSLGLPGAPRLDPSEHIGDEALTQSPVSTMSPRHGNASPHRSTSPTKGLGGFVQSAMMKRSDSVKRWSVTSPPGLARIESMASNRNSMIASIPSSKSRPTSRPTSRHGIDDSDAKSTTSTSAFTHGATMIDVADHESDAPDTSHTTDKQEEEDHLKSPPMSPTKTADPRRWSPTKSSWLETALNKPDSPKPKHAPSPSMSQPSWMADLNKAKAAKTAPDGPLRTQSTHKHEVSIGGLMRHSPMGAGVKPSQVGLGGVYSPPAALSQQRPITGSSIVTSNPVSSVRSTFAKSTSSVTSQSSAHDSGPEATTPIKETPKDSFREQNAVPIQQQPKELSLRDTLKETTSKDVLASSPAKISPTDATSVKDFRAALRPRQQTTTNTSASADEKVPEFKNVFGTLRRAKTEKFVPQDDLKDNILRGKAALTNTGGPKKTERVDDLKEAILRKRAEFKQAQAEGKGITTNAKPNEEKSLPEGLSRRAELGRSGTVSFARKKSMPDLGSDSLRRPSLPAFDLPMPDTAPMSFDSDADKTPDTGKTSFEGNKSMEDAMAAVAKLGINSDANSEASSPAFIKSPEVKSPEFVRSPDLVKSPEATPHLHEVVKSPEPSRLDEVVKSPEFFKSPESVRSSAEQTTPRNLPSPRKQPSRDFPTPSSQSRLSTRELPTPLEPTSHSSPQHRPRMSISGGLANRMSANLAGLLARGPPPMAGGSNSDNQDGDSTEPSAPGPQLTHITKNRARGPRRKAPSSAAPATVAAASPASTPRESSTVSTPMTNRSSARASHDDNTSSSEGYFSSVSEKQMTPQQQQQQQQQQHSTPSAAAASTPFAQAAQAAQAAAIRKRASSVFSRHRSESVAASMAAAAAATSPFSILESPSTQTSPIKETMAERLLQSERPSPQADAFPSPPARQTPQSLQQTPHSQHSQQSVSQHSTSQQSVSQHSTSQSISQQSTSQQSQPSSPRKLDKRRMSMFMEDRPQLDQPATGQAPAEPAKEASLPISTEDLVPKPLATRSRSRSPTKVSDRLPDHDPISPKKRETLVDMEPAVVSVKEGRPEHHEQQQYINHRQSQESQPAPQRHLEQSPEIQSLQHQSEKLSESQQLPQRQSVKSPESQQLPQHHHHEQTLESQSLQRLHRQTQEFAAPAPVAATPPPTTSDRARSQSRSGTKTPMRTPSLAPSRSLSRPPTRPGSPNRSPTRQRLEACTLLEEFFGPNRPQRDYRVDSASILLDRQPAPARIRTVSATLFQILGYGKKTQVSAHHERELFEQNMYLCAHSFMNEQAKTVSQVYFWVGDDVPSSAVRDVEKYIVAEAKALGGALVRLRQGAESAEFLQALGGVVVVRRGSANKYDSLAPSMLCGRRFNGQVTFDEVDFGAASLCSGFPFLITCNGRCFLWIGKGSDVDELSCARLIGMDLTLTGELEEVDDGNEPATFWDIFGGGPPMTSADHWRLKPNYDRYCGRLFCADGSTQQQIVEIRPFCQRDMLRSNIYVLDAFFEMYVIVGAKAQTQYGAFRTALEFAQEYAILASGMEDRPFIPISTVVLEGIPRDLKSVFRKWKDVDSPTIMSGLRQSMASPPGGLKRGRSLRIVPLTQALAAMND